MKNKKYIYPVLLFIICIISISAVNAANDSPTDIISTDSNDNEELILEESIDEDLSLGYDEGFSIDDNEEEIFNEANEETRVSESSGTFTDLDNDINGNEDAEITLNKNYTFNPDTDSSLKEGIKIKRNVSINGNGINIDGNNMAGIFQINGKNVNIKNINFINARIEEGSGAAIYMESAHDSTVSNCTFINNTAYLGGGISWISGKNGSVSNCTFINNSAINEKTMGGGAVFWYAPNGTISNCTFENNSAKIGGALHLYYSSGTISDSTFRYNTATQSGGAIYTEEISGAIYGDSANNYIAISACTFENNNATMDGGAISLYFSANCSVSNSKFIRNTADDGGAISCDSLLNNSVSDSNFTDNKAGYNGGAIYWISNNGSVSNCNFIDNMAESDGGSIYWHFEDGSISDSNFTANIAESNGGAISGKGNAINCNFIDNKAKNSGGALNRGTATNCYFRNNHANEESGCGGAINEGNAINCTYENNTAYNGGAINEGNAINCTFKNNTAYNGGAIYKGNAINSKFIENKVFEDEGTPGKGEAMNQGIAVNCTFNGNENFETKTYDAATLNTADYESVYNSDDTLSIELLAGDDKLKGITAKIIVYEDGEELGTFYAPTGDGWEVSLSPGEYIAKISIEELPEIDSVTANLKISKASTMIFAQDTAITFNASRQFLSANLREENYNSISFANIIVNIDGTNSTLISDQNGEIRISARNLAVGSHIVTIMFGENENYTETTRTAIMTILPCPTEIECGGEYIAEYNSSDEIVVGLYNNEGKTLSNLDLTVYLNGEKTYTTDKKGQIHIPLNELPGGFYTAIIKFKGNENYTESSAIANVTIRKVDTQLSAVNITASYNADKIFIISLKDSESRPIANAKLSISLNGILEKITDENGEVKIPIKGLAPNTYTVLIIFNGDEKYAKTSTSGKVVIKKLDCAITISPSKTITYNKATDKKKDYYIFATLKDANGNPLIGKTVKYSTNGKLYTAKTNSKGQIKFVLAQASKGKCNVAVSFLGDEQYNACLATKSIKINPQKVKLSAKKKTFKAKKKVKKLTATLKNAKGKALKGKKIVFAVNGKKYIAKTNKKGVATVKVRLSKKKTYKASIKFAGDKTYKKASKKVRITVK